jgi:hypothetical protein
MSGERCRLGAATMLAATLAACGASADTPTPSATAAAPTASPANPSGAMAGFLAAASLQDNGQVPAWLATSADTNDLAEVVSVYNQFGNGIASGLFWAVGGLHVVSASQSDATHAQVTLNGPVVWCLGRTASDPTAACSAVNGVPGLAHTYAALSVNGRWKVDIDINASTQLDQNPQATPSGRATTPTPS